MISLSAATCSGTWMYVVGFSYMPWKAFACELSRRLLLSGPAHGCNESQETHITLMHTSCVIGAQTRTAAAGFSWVAYRRVALHNEGQVADWIKLEEQSATNKLRVGQLEGVCCFPGCKALDPCTRYWSTRVVESD